MLVAAQETAGSGFTVEIWLALIPSVVTLLVFAYNARGDSLRKAERLSEVADKMPESSERTVVEVLRDDYITTWALRQMAPVHAGYRVAAYSFFALGVVVTAWWINLGPEDEDEWWYDAVFLAGLLCSFAAAFVWLRRESLQRKWIQRERATRGLRVPQHSRLHDAVYPGSGKHDTRVESEE